MQPRPCAKCEYDLTGLAVNGNLATCPECAHVNDLSIPFKARVSTYRPMIVSLIFVAPFAVFMWIISPPVWVWCVFMAYFAVFIWRYDIVLHRRRARAGKCPSCGHYLGGIEPGSPCPGCKKPAPPTVPDP